MDVGQDTGYDRNNVNIMRSSLITDIQRSANCYGCLVTSEREREREKGVGGGGKSEMFQRAEWRREGRVGVKGGGGVVRPLVLVTLVGGGGGCCSSAVNTCTSQRRGLGDTDMAVSGIRH